LEVFKTMKLKKTLSIVVMLAMFGALALTASGMAFGNTEDEDYWRIELYNEWGPTATPANFTVPAGEVLRITFTLSGIPAGNYPAQLGIGGTDWFFKGDSPFVVNVTGDGTYVLEASWADDFDIAQVLVIDIAGLASALGITELGTGDTGGAAATASYTIGAAAAAAPVAVRDADGGAKAGVGDVAVASAIALVAAGAVVFSRKRK
jgi:hypothetical protein